MVKIFNRRGRPPNETADLRLERREDMLFVVGTKDIQRKARKGNKGRSPRRIRNGGQREQKNYFIL